MNYKKPQRDFKFLLSYFFKDYLPNQRGLSPNTIASYKETFKLFVPWLSKRTSKKEPSIDDISIFLLFEFLNHLEKERNNSIHTRNARLAALKTFFKMTYFLLPDIRKTHETVQYLEAKRACTPLIDYFEHHEVEKILSTVKKHKLSGFRDYTILTLLYNTGMRATEVASLKLSCYQKNKKVLEIIGKGNKWRQVPLWPKTTHLMERYIQKKRHAPKPAFKESLFINQNGETLTRSGVYKICKKYIDNVPQLKKRFLSSKRSAVHSWRHTAAVHMLRQGFSPLEVKLQLGHSQIDTTYKYLRLDLTTKRERINAFIKFTEQIIGENDTAPVNWSKEKEVLKFLKSL